LVFVKLILRAPGYFADARGLANEQVIKDAIAGLSDPKEIEDTLAELLRSRSQAQDFMWWRLKMRK
jgi:mannitol-1-phosphate/altronate dehydrogenase